MADFEKQIGALWLKTSIKGVSFMSGELTIDDKKIKVTVFKNNHKTKDNQPDYQIYPMRDLAAPVPITPTAKEDIDDEGVPF